MNIIDAINQFIIELIENLGYLGIFLAMLVEGVFTPIPSELVMPFAGYIASTGELNYYLVIIIGSLGAVCGSFIAYSLARSIGRPVIDRYGIYIGLDARKMDKADGWFEKYGIWGILIGHSLPGIRSIISFPAGVAKMDRPKFILFTFIGAMIWNTVLVTAGYLMGKDWINFWKETDGWDLIVLGAAALILIGYLVLTRYRDRLTKKPNPPQDI